MNFVSWASNVLDSLDDSSNKSVNPDDLTQQLYENAGIVHIERPKRSNSIVSNTVEHTEPSITQNVPLQTDTQPTESITQSTESDTGKPVEEEQKSVSSSNATSPQPTVNTLTSTVKAQPVIATPATNIKPATTQSSVKPTTQSSTTDNKYVYRIHNLETENASLRNVWQETRTKLSKTKQLLTDKELQYQSALSTLELQFNEQLQQQRSEYEQQLRTVEQQSKELTVENETLQLNQQQNIHSHSIEYDILQQQYNELQQQNGKLQTEIRTVQSAYEHVNNNQQHLIQQHTELLQTLKAEQLQHEQLLEQQIQQQQYTINQLQLQNTAVQSNDSNAQYTYTIETLKQQLTDIQRQNERLQQEKQYLQTDITTLQQQLDTSIQQQKQLDQHIANIQLKNNEALNKLHNELDSTKQQLQQSNTLNAQLQQQLQQYTTQQQTHHSTNNNVNSELTDRLKSMSDNLYNKSQLIEQLISEKSTLTVKLENTNIRIKQLEQRNQSLREQLQSIPYADSNESDDDLEASITLPKQRRTVPNTASKHKHRVMNVSHNQTIDRVLTNMDNFIYKSIGIVLKKYEKARVAFILYLLLLHLWCIVILFHFVHHETSHSMTQLPDDDGMSDLIKTNPNVHT